ncbi:hypothetical protein JCM19038_3947 [Geomicrobium sp. JCM 19038]|nr:hypothetical protein JCM19038_3947 [Geomicrobium sp. JCM 19038]
MALQFMNFHVNDHLAKKWRTVLNGSPFFRLMLSVKKHQVKPKQILIINHEYDWPLFFYNTIVSVTFTNSFE